MPGKRYSVSLPEGLLGFKGEVYDQRKLKLPLCLGTVDTYGLTFQSLALFEITRPFTCRIVVLA